MDLLPSFSVSSHIQAGLQVCALTVTYFTLNVNVCFRNSTQQTCITCLEDTVLDAESLVL